MKKLLCYLFISLFALASCSKDDGGGDEETNPLVDAISTKWDVSSSDQYVSIELTKSGSYIVVENRPIRSLEARNVIFGTYDNTIELIDFGTLTVNSIDNTNLNCSIKLKDSQSSIALTAQKSNEMPTSSRTELMCRTWDIYSWNGDTNFEDEKDGAYRVLMSRAGTYLVSHRDGTADLSSWKWKEGTNETQFYYSWQLPPVWNEENLVEVTELTSSIFTVHETGDVTVLKPAVLGRSSVATSTPLSGEKQGFLGNK